MLRQGAALLFAAVAGVSILSSGAMAAEPPLGSDVAGAWHGTSSGAERGACAALTVDLRVTGGRVGGTARSRGADGKPVEWRVFGLVDSAGQVTLETSHVVASSERRLEHVVWTGRVEGDRIRLTRGAEGACTQPQTLELSRN